MTKLFQTYLSILRGLNVFFITGDWNQIPYDYTVEVTNRFKGLDLVDTVPEEIWTVIFHSRWWSELSPRKRNAEGKMVVWGSLTNI